MCCSAHHDTFSANDGDKRVSSGDFSSTTTACSPRDTDPWGNHDVSSGTRFGAYRGSDSWSSRAADRDRESSMKSWTVLRSVFPSVQESSLTTSQFRKSWRRSLKLRVCFLRKTGSNTPRRRTRCNLWLWKKSLTRWEWLHKNKISARICEQIMEVSVSQDTEQLIEMAKIESYRELWKRSLLFPVHDRLRNLRSRQRSGR